MKEKLLLVLLVHLNYLLRSNSISVMMVLLRTCNQGLCDRLVIILVFKFSVLPVTHHEQVALKFLLLRRIQLAFLVVAVIFLFLTVLGSVTLLFILLVIAETCLIRLLLLLLRYALSITKMSLCELFISP